MNSINGYEFYIVIRKDGKYLISTCEFSIVFPSQTTNDYIFQMLKDTHFNCIVNETDDLYYEVVAIKHVGKLNTKKLLIIDYYNQGKTIDFIKPILKFNCNKIQDSIKITNHNGFEEQTLTINNTHSDDYLKHIKDNYSDQSIEFYNYLNEIQLSFIVNDYEGKKYISNPTFKLNVNYLNNLL
jgi:hypothetical protein